MADPREPPVNYEAEQALLGAILANNDALEKVADFLSAEQFAEPAHGRIFDRCAALIDAGKIANAVTLKETFDRDNDLEDVGGARYLAELQGNFVSIINARDYGRVINDLYVRRCGLGAAEYLLDQMRDFSDADQTPRRVLEQHVAEIDAVLSRDQAARGLEPIGLDAQSLKDDIAEAADRRRSGLTAGTSTGLPKLDRALCGGLRAGHLVVLGGATSMGKTALGISVAQSIARQYGPVAYFSLEMMRDEIERRIACGLAGIDLGATLRGDLSAEQIAALGQQIDGLREIPLHVDSGFQTTPASIRSWSRRLARSGGLWLVVVDYLQLMSDLQQGQNRTAELTAITRALKILAMELGVPVLLLSQLSRYYERRENKRPVLSDLRESGSIEQDANDVLFCHRPAYFMEREGPGPKEDETAWRADLEAAKTKCEIIVAKQRNGPLSTVELGFDAPTTRFWDDEQQQPEIPF